MNKKIIRTSALLLICLVMLFSNTFAFAADDGSMHIDSPEDLLSLAEKCALDTWSQNIKVVLDADISLDGVDFTPIPSFGGSFDGGGHTISGLDISDKYTKAGLFAEIQEGGSVKNLNVTGSIDISGSGEAAGGIAGINSGSIISCTFTGSVSASTDTGGIVGENTISGSVHGCTASGTVSGSKMTGGIVGYNLGLIASCSNSAYVNTVNEDKTISVQDISIDTTFDLSKLATQDTVSSSTDTGGIAGYSSGIIRNCSNDAIIGYQHVGYNVGGIAGRSCGYITSCTNSSEIFGRKDVGGIVGQMEPYMELNVENSTMAKLQQQLDELSTLINKAADDAQGGSGAVSSRLSAMGGYVGNAINEAGNVSVNIGGSGDASGDVSGESDGSIDINVDTPQIDAYIQDDYSAGGTISGGFEIIATPDLSGLAAAINGIGSQLSILNGEISGATGAVANDIREINEKFNELSNTMIDAIFTIGTEDGDILSDTSGIDAELVRLGKISICTNNGDVSGDINIGGVAGAMAIEYEYDPEDDVTSNISAEYKHEYELKAVLQRCTNNAAVTARRSYVGSVTGRMDLGLITDCRGFGSVESESGDYVGGIAGLASATLRTNWAKCTLSGGKYVGGITGSGIEEALTGSGSTVTHCVSMVEIASAEQYYGAISGSDAGEYLENYFVSDTLAGIDGKSISGKAEPISYKNMLQIDGIPSEFKKLTLSFVADDETIKELSFDYGDSFTPDAYPEIPAKEGYYGRWDKAELTKLHFDTVVTAEYELEYSAINTDSTRSDGRAVLFVEGSYGNDALLECETASLKSSAETDTALNAAVDENSSSKLPLLARISTSINGGILEQLWVTIPDDGQQTHTLHYLPPEVAVGSIDIYVMQNGHWVRADTEEFGSYLVFDVSGTQADIAAVSVINLWWLWLLLAAVLIAVVITVIIIVKKHHTGRKHTSRYNDDDDIADIEDADCTEYEDDEPVNAPQDAEKSEPEFEAEEAESKTSKRPHRRKKTAKRVKKSMKKNGKKALIIVAAVLVVCAIAVAAVLYFAPGITGGIAVYRMISAVENADNVSMNVSVDADLGGESYELQVPLAIKNDGDNKIVYAQIEGVPVYYSNGMIILENGRAYGKSGSFPDYSSLIATISSYYADIEYSSDDNTHRVSISGDQATELLKTLCPSLDGSIDSIDEAYIETSVADGKTESIEINVSGDTKDSGAFTVNAVIDDFNYDTEITIPDAVTQAAAEGEDGMTEISDEVFDVAAALSELSEREAVSTDVTLSANCGPVVLDTTLGVDTRVVDGKRLYCVSKNSLKLYTDGNSVVNANGKGVSSEESSVAGSAKLLKAVYLACLDGDISASHSGKNNTYTISFDGDTVEQLIELISPEAAELDADFSYGTVSLTLTDGSVSKATVSCTGTMKVVLVDMSVSVGAEIDIKSTTPSDFPQAAVEALT